MGKKCPECGKPTRRESYACSRECSDNRRNRIFREKRLEKKGKRCSECGLLFINRLRKAMTCSNKCGRARMVRIRRMERLQERLVRGD